MTIGFKVPDFNPEPDSPCFCGSGQAFGSCCGNKSPKRRPPAGVRVFPGFVDRETCAAWVRYLESRPRQRTQVLDLERSRPDAPVFVEDQARVCDDVNAGALRDTINSTVAIAYDMVSEDLGREVEWFEFPSVLRYSPGGYYIRHSDSCQVGEDQKTWHKVQDRDLSLLLYINDDFTGGGLSFTRFHCHYRPRIGDLLVFPSDNRYEHRADVVKSGFRYAIVSWAACKGERRVRTEAPEGAIMMSDVLT